MVQVVVTFLDRHIPFAYGNELRALTRQYSFLYIVWGHGYDTPPHSHFESKAEDMWDNHVLRSCSSIWELALKQAVEFIENCIDSDDNGK
jgi:hypothetical protein